MSDTNRNTLHPHGDRYPFTVPDAYFENLTARIMDQLPEEKEAEPVKKVDIQQWRHRSKWTKGLAIAASLAIIAVVGLQVLPTSTDTTQSDTMLAEYTIEDYNEDLLTYAMADNIDVYNYLSNDTDN